MKIYFSGILALAVAVGKSLEECLGLYFKMKNVAFAGKRPYPSEAFEKILKDAFGSETTMSSIVKPKYGNNFIIRALIGLATSFSTFPIVLRHYDNHGMLYL